MTENDSARAHACSNFIRHRLSDERPGVTCAQLFDVEVYALDWQQQGSFLGADGRPVRAYDDVVLLRDVMPENDADAASLACAGSTGTILFFSNRPDGVAQIELNFPPPPPRRGPIVVADEDQRFLKLHMTNEEKYPR